MAFPNDDISINTLIGPGSFIQGDLNVKGFIRFDGDIDGNLETTGKLIIGEQARIRGNIHATSAIIHGIVEGDVVAPEGVRLFSTATVIGDIVSKKILVEEKVFVQGQCIIFENSETFETAKKAWQDEKAIKKRTLLVSRSNR